MLAARDQENLVHTHQTTAAGKPLNQGNRALQPKTPRNLKTPFRSTQNDENKAFGFNNQKPGGKGDDGKLEKGVFVTPMGELAYQNGREYKAANSLAGPRNRAPLGMKTTNAKAHLFKTPGPQQKIQQAERTSKRPSATRPSAKKFTVAPEPVVETEALQSRDEDDVSEIEYAPPAPIELPDPPMEFGYDQTFPQFQGMNIMRGYGELHASPKDESGMSLRLRQEKDKHEQVTRDMEAQLLQSIEEYPDSLVDDTELERQVEAMIKAGPRNRRTEDAKVDTIKARSAAGMLSQTSLPSAAFRETKSSLQKKRKPAFAVLGSKPAPEPTNPSPMRHTAAAVLSKNTIGYPKARKAPSIIPKMQQRNAGQTPSPHPHVDQSRIHPNEFKNLYGEPPVESDMWFRLREYELLEEERPRDETDIADDLFDTDFFPVGAEDDEEIFQLPMPE